MAMSASECGTLALGNWSVARVLLELVMFVHIACIVFL